MVDEPVRVALFVTCVGDTLLPEAGRATVSVLERLGHEVVFPAEQTCCGQMHVNSGYRQEALRLARHFARVFDGYDVVVAPSASCVGMVREYPELAREPATRRCAAVEELAPRVFELSELLVYRLGVTDVGASPGSASPTTRPATHFGVTRVGDAPLRLLAGVEHSSCRAPAGRGVLRLRWDLRGEERRHLGRDGVDKCGAIVRPARGLHGGRRSCLLQIGGRLSRERPRRPDAAPGPDPPGVEAP